jgi:2-oxo-4-hydroxy-4-carboxy-5-ureidoimidazoline decarboxylase
MTDWRQVPVSRDTLNSRQAFVKQFGAIYEHSSWVANEIWGDLTGDLVITYDAIVVAMARAVASAPEDAKLQLLRCHPELASKAALAGELTEASNREQSGAGLDRCSPAELVQIQQLNADYGAKFGFPFIIAVTGLTRSDIIAAMAKRITNPCDMELAEALSQVDRIAQIRLAALASAEQESNL